MPAIETHRKDRARLPVDVSSLADGDDLHVADSPPHASGRVMLAPEEQFPLELRAKVLQRNVVERSSAIRAVLVELESRRLA